jgi:hypothetical protein
LCRETICVRKNWVSPSVSILPRDGTGCTTGGLISQWGPGTSSGVMRFFFGRFPEMRRPPYVGSEERGIGAVRGEPSRTGRFRGPKPHTREKNAVSDLQTRWALRPRSNSDKRAGNNNLRSSFLILLPPDRWNPFLSLTHLLPGRGRWEPPPCPDKSLYSESAGNARTK